MKKAASKKHHHPELDDLLSVLKTHELKLTPPRKLILQALLENHGPFSAEELHHRFAKEACDLATIYRNLLNLEKAQILKRCDFGDGVARYELMPANDEHHHHLVCKKCKKVEVLDLCEMEEKLNRYAKKRGFKDVSHTLEFFGTCPRCQ